MKSARFHSLVLVTAPSARVARQLVSAALRARLIACGNLVPAVESHYWWQGRMESSREVLCVLKARKTALARLERLVLSLHPYDTPEFLVLPLVAGSARYLEWLVAETAPAAKVRRVRRRKGG
jgi:periplasmic divalent cation tolerance protein